MTATADRVQLAARPDGRRPFPIWLAVRCSHRYGDALEDSTEDHEDLMDADTNKEVLIKRINDHYALPETMNFERGNRFTIKPGEMRSNTVNGRGGGCMYNAHIEIRECPSCHTTPKENVK